MKQISVLLTIFLVFIIVGSNQVKGIVQPGDRESSHYGQQLKQQKISEDNTWESVPESRPFGFEDSRSQSESKRSIRSSQYSNWQHASAVSQGRPQSRQQQPDSTTQKPDSPTQQPGSPPPSDMPPSSGPPASGGSGGSGLRDKFSAGMQIDGSQFPWAVLLYATIPIAFGDFHFICIGTLISTQYVLTSASCVVEFNYPYSMVAVGNGFITYVDRIKIHPGYNDGIKDYNIALLKLSEMVNLTKELQLLCLPPPKINAVNQNATSVGLSGKELDGSPTTMLRGINVQVLSKDACRKNFEATSNYQISGRPSNVYITSRMLCTLPTKGGMDTCRGDEGGPLVLNCGGNNVAIGVVSHEANCGMPKTPTVYTGVSHLLPWIQMTTNFATCSQHCTGHLPPENYYQPKYYPSDHTNQHNNYPAQNKNDYQKAQNYDGHNAPRSPISGDYGYSNAYISPNRPTYPAPSGYNSPRGY